MSILQRNFTLFTTLLSFTLSCNCCNINAKHDSSHDKENVANEKNATYIASDNYSENGINNDTESETNPNAGLYSEFYSNGDMQLDGTSFISSENDYDEDFEKGKGYMFVTETDIPEKVIFADETIDFRRYDMRERLDREILNFCNMHTNTTLIIKRANRYLPEIEQILKKEGMPDDLKYLMLIESNCNPLARSCVGAVGLWQFMEGTAREFGLTVNKYVDERYDIRKSTIAACKYLKKAYAKYGNWTATVASYNAGQNKISAELRKQKVEHATDLYLNSETSRYIFRILAAKIIFENQTKYGYNISTKALYPPMIYKEVVVDTTITNLTDWARNQGITYAILRDANPWLRANELPCDGKKYTIRIPDKKWIYYDPSKTKRHNFKAK